MAADIEPVPGPPGWQTGSTGRGARRADQVFRGVSLASGLAVLAVLAAIAAFLVYRAIPAFQHDSTSFWSTKVWLPDNEPSTFGVLALAFGTAFSAALALAMAWPVSIGIALFITDYAPRRLSTVLGYVVDTLAAVPSVIYGLWGLYWLVPHLTPLQSWLARNAGWFPLFADPNGQALTTSKSIFAASLVLAVMIIPIISAISRDVMAQVDPASKEAALALGATRAQMVRHAVIPPSRPGLVGATILGLGRALGETIAVALVLGSSYVVNLHILVPGKNTIAANIATQFGEAGSVGRPALIASGLVLFAMTLAVNLIARGIIYRSGAMERSAL